MAESPRVTELRREIAEMEANQSHLDPAMTHAMLASLREDLAEALAIEPTQASEVRSWCSRCRVVHLPGEHPVMFAEPNTPSPAALAAMETPMPRKTPPPAERLEVLGKRLAATTSRKAASLARMAIRKHCEAHGLPVPEKDLLNPAEDAALAALEAR